MSNLIGKTIDLHVENGTLRINITNMDEDMYYGNVTASNALLNTTSSDGTGNIKIAKEMLERIPHDIIENNIFENIIRKHLLIENNSDVKAENIKRLYIEEEPLYLEWNNNDYDKAWEEMLDETCMGDCQNIAKWIKDIADKNGIKGIEHVFGEIKILEGIYENKIMTHHWNTIDGKIYEYSKGTLKNYVDFDNLYSIDAEESLIEYGYTIIYSI